MTLTSLQRRKARGRAADTAARPPTRTKSSISVVTNKTLKTTALVAAATYRCKNGSNSPIHNNAHCVRSFLSEHFPVDAAQFRVTAAQPKRMAGKAEGALRNDYSRQ